jgi:hypothetical protein
MRYLWLGFHIVMALLLVLAFIGAFSPAPTGNFAHDNGSYIPSVIGIVVIWIAGAIILRIVRRFSNY